MNNTKVAFCPFCGLKPMVGFFKVVISSAGAGMDNISENDDTILFAACQNLNCGNNNNFLTLEKWNKRK